MPKAHIEKEGTRNRVKAVLEILSREEERRNRDEAIPKHGNRRDNLIIDDGARWRHRGNHHEGVSERGGRDAGGQARVSDSQTRPESSTENR